MSQQKGRIIEDLIKNLKLHFLKHCSGQDTLAMFVAKIGGRVLLDE